MASLPDGRTSIDRRNRPERSPSTRCRLPGQRIEPHVHPPEPQPLRPERLMPSVIGATCRSDPVQRRANNAGECVVIHERRVALGHDGVERADASLIEWDRRAA